MQAARHMFAFWARYARIFAFSARYVMYTEARARGELRTTSGITWLLCAPGAAHLGHHRPSQHPHLGTSHPRCCETVVTGGGGDGGGDGGDGGGGGIGVSCAIT